MTGVLTGFTVPPCMCYSRRPTSPYQDDRITIYLAPRRSLKCSPQKGCVLYATTKYARVGTSLRCRNQFYKKQRKTDENSTTAKNSQFCALKKYTSRPYQTNVKRRHWSMSASSVRNNIKNTISFISYPLNFLPPCAAENCTFSVRTDSKGLIK